MTNTQYPTFDDALHASWEQGFESPAETEEREAIQAANPWGLLTDSERVALDDEVAEAYDEYLRTSDDPWGAARYGVETFAEYRRRITG